MALKARVAALDSLDDSVKSLYRQEGDSFVLDVEAVSGWALEDVGGLKSSLQKERSSRESAEKTLKPYKNDDGTYVSAGDARDAFRKVEEFSKLDPDKDAEKLAQQKIEDAKTVMQAGFEAKETVWREREGLLLQGAASARVNTAIDLALADPEVAGIPKGLKPILMPEVGWREQDGSISIFVRNPEDPSRAKLNGSGDEMTIKERALELKSDEDLAGLFKAPKQRGSGPTPPHHAGPSRSSDKNATGVARIANALRDPNQVRGAAGDNFG